MAEWVMQKCMDGLRKIPGWVWRMMISVILGYKMLEFVVPWAWAQRGYQAIGGEYTLVLAVTVLPFIHFRR